MKTKKYISFIFSLMIVFIIQSCHKEEVVNISKPHVNLGQEITSDTLSGSIKGTLLSGKTYYFRNNIVINAGDTLLAQEGVKLIAMGDGSSYDKSPQITVNGTFISLGTQDKPNFFTVEPSKAIPENVFKGLWGGIQGGVNGGDMILKWTHVEYVGGPAGPENDPAVYESGDPRYAISFANINGNFILEDSWISNTKDDGIRVVSGKISIMRNTFENNGESAGESFNAKSGTVGDVAYNLFIGSATNGTKISNSGGTAIQCNINLYNNTYLNSGLRQVKSGRGGSIDYEKGAKGKVYNNMIVNCRYGLKFTKDADLSNISYDNQFFYASSNNLFTGFYPSDGLGSAKPGDVIGSAPGQNNPAFASYNVDVFDYSAVTIPMGYQDMPVVLRSVGNSNFNLLPGSPAINKGNTGFQPLGAVTNTGTYGADITPPGNDIGAFQADGSGNKH